MAYIQNNPFLRKESKKELEKVVSSEDPQWVDDPTRYHQTYTLNPDYDALERREIQSPDNYVKLPNDERSYLRPRVIKNLEGGPGNRYDEIPTFESLEPSGNEIQDIANYELLKKNVADSLALVNKGDNWAAASIYGDNLGKDARMMTKMDQLSSHNANLMNNLRGYQNTSGNYNASDDWNQYSTLSSVKPDSDFAQQNPNYTGSDINQSYYVEGQGPGSTGFTGGKRFISKNEAGEKLRGMRNLRNNIAGF